jgi:hypothetical protein
MTIPTVTDITDKQKSYINIQIERIDIVLLAFNGDILTGKLSDLTKLQLLCDACSVYFRKPWWLARQMISEAANTELTLTVDENGVSSKSFSRLAPIDWRLHGLRGHNCSNLYGEFLPERDLE